MKSRLLGVLILLGSMVLPAALELYPEPQARAASQNPIPSAESSDEREPIVVPGTMPVDDSIATAVLQVLRDAHDSAAGAPYYAITDLHSIGAWHFISVAGLESETPNWRLEDAIWTGLVLLHRPEDRPWDGAVEGTDRFSRLLDQVPDAVMDPHARKELDPTPVSYTHLTLPTILLV